MLLFTGINDAGREFERERGDRSGRAITSASAAAESLPV
jgi:hypothetical protein